MNDNKLNTNNLMPDVIKQTEIIELEGKNNIKKQTFLHCVGPDATPLIDWSTYESTSFSKYKPNVLLKSSNESNNIKPNPTVTGRLLKQTEILQTSNQLLQNIGVDKEDRGVTDYATFVALTELNQDEKKKHNNFGTDDIRRNKVKGRFNVMIAKMQLKISDWTGNPNKLQASAERNLIVGRLQLNKPVN
ncbi:hypothetical protein K502DRAFT_346342 [Neoconidiobolus thromboides FSU 785]|nr:hypothetical protein K502DRAFT_346342 [Neoconidiobolus thromboides FSU 785]